jgi:diaminopimelate epimerase
MPFLSFTKMAGAGNDFIVVDNRTLRLTDVGAASLARLVCPRRTSVGADGLLLLDASRETDFRMRYYNADGSRAPFCGNGARCLARFAYRRGIVGQEMAFDADDGRHQATIVGREVRLRLVDPTDILLNRPIQGFARSTVVHTLNTGTVHAVIRSDDVAAEDVARDGRALRSHPMFQPGGTNVNFVQTVAPSGLALRTYERGVEAETLSCGTGAAAAAVTFALLDDVPAPITVHTRSGEPLLVDFQRDGDSITGVSLQGSAHIIYDGELAEDVGVHLRADGIMNEEILNPQSAIRNPQSV